MKKILLISAAFILLTNGLFAQKYLTKEGEIEIFSETSLFTIEAKNQKVASILNGENGEVVASTLVRSFKFREALVEEHFNENYMESEKFPKSIFKGKITNFSSINLNKDGSYDATIEGNLTIHGETRPVTTKCTLLVKGTSITAKTEFLVSLANYKIIIEDSYKDRIKDEIKLMVHFDYNKMEK